MVVTFCEAFMELLTEQTFTERVADMPELEASSAANAIAQALETSPVTTFDTFLAMEIWSTATVKLSLASSASVATLQIGGSRGM